MGSILSPLEADEGYDPNYSAAVNICSAPTGILIPPSGPLILYSITAGGVSVAALFMGGYFVGAILGLCVAVVAIALAVKKGYKKSEVKDPDPAWKIWVDAIPSLLAVIIVMGGILAWKRRTSFPSSCRSALRERPSRFSQWVTGSSCCFPSFRKAQVSGS